jgi:predicted Fe-Mo cluster-binding NifX family protein
MIVCVPVTTDGQIGPAWGKAGRVAVARVEADGIADWDEFEVGWDRLHDEGTEGGHHARIARFLVEHKVGMVVSGHMGPPMQQMLGRMGITVRLGAQGDARQAVARARQALA